MRNLFFVLVFLSFCTPAFSQTVIMADDGAFTAGNSPSVLDIKSVLEGILGPRMTQVQRIAIAAPADGLLVYQTEATKGFYDYNRTNPCMSTANSRCGQQLGLARERAKPQASV